MPEFNHKKNLIGFEVPFDVVNLPSQGMFYPNGRSSLAVRYITAMEENVLTSPSLTENGMAIDIVLGSVIMDNDVDVDDLLSVDRDAILIYLRSTSYGDKFPVAITCPACNKTGETSFNLSDISIKESFEKPDGDGCYSFTLPKMRLNSKPVTISFKPMTVRLEKEMMKEMSKKIANREISDATMADVSSKYVAKIVSVNGNTDKSFIRKVVRNMLLPDSVAFRAYMESVEPGMDNTVKLACPNCTSEFEEKFFVGKEILKLPPTYRQNVMEELFLLTYYGKGITRSDAFRMAVTERRWMIQRIAEEIERKNKAEQKAVEQAKRQSKFK